MVVFPTGKYTLCRKLFCRPVHKKADNIISTRGSTRTSLSNRLAGLMGFLGRIHSWQPYPLFILHDLRPELMLGSFIADEIALLRLLLCTYRFTYT
jgi:hypothetical protein